MENQRPPQGTTDWKSLATAARKPAELLPPMPARPTLRDFFELRLRRTARVPFEPRLHMIQSATAALQQGADEETVLACLLHDMGHAIQRADHGWWGAQLLAPYVPEKVSWAIRHHQALRYYPDPEVGYAYPELYLHLFGEGYRPPAYIETAYREARAHRWYMHARMITVFDDYSFERDTDPSLEPFADIIGRHFAQPAEGLGFDGSAVAHMWRTIIDPDKPV